MEREMIIVIPAYEPDEKMIFLLEEMQSQNMGQILVIDDGSGNAYEAVFQEAEKYAKVLRHTENRGKGEAIKTALCYIQKEYKAAVIAVADADGQHKVRDIKRVLEEAAKRPEQLVMGSREFKGKIPFRSRFGNAVTRLIFEMVSHVKVRDTQTGLRAFQESLIPFLLQVEGSRYEYEMNVLLACAKSKISIFELPIETVYIGKNESSHFNAVLDSIRIYRYLLRFSFSSFLAFCIDFALYTSVLGLTGQILLSNVVARVISAGMNFMMNRQFVFESRENVWKEAGKYFMLAAFILCLNSAMLTYLTGTVRLNQYTAKITTEIIMFGISFMIQKNLVFITKTRKGKMLHAAK